MVAILRLEDAQSIDSAPSGWTLQGTDTSGYTRLYTKVASSESGSYTWSWSTSACKARVQIAAYRGGFDTSDPVDAVSNTDYTTDNTTLRAASFSVSNTGSTIIFAGSVFETASARTFSPPTNPGTFTEDVDTGDTTSDIFNTFAHYEWSSSGSTGDIDGTLSLNSPDKHAFAISLNPPTNPFTAAGEFPVPTAAATFENSNDFTAAGEFPVPTAAATFANTANPFTAAGEFPVPTAAATFTQENDFTAAGEFPVPAAAATFENLPNAATFAGEFPVPTTAATFTQENDFIAAGSFPLPIAEAYFDAGVADRPDAWARWACESFGDDTVTPAIWEHSDPDYDLTPGDGVTASTFPTHTVNAPGIEYYAFDGVDDYLSNWPTMPDTYVVSAALSDSYPDGQPYIVQCDDDTVETLLTTPGAFAGNLHNLVIFDSAITAAEKDAWAAYQLRRLWRDTYVNPYAARMIRRGDDVGEYVFTVSGDPYADYSETAASVTPTGITWDDGLTFDNGSSAVTVPDAAALRGREISVFASGDFAGGHLIDKGTNYEIDVAYSAGSVTITANGVASAAIPVATLYSVGVVMVNSLVPVFYVNGLLADTGGSPVTVDKTATDDLLIGNQAGGSDEFTGTLKRLSVVTRALTAAEIFMLHLAAMADF